MHRRRDRCSDRPEQAPETPRRRRPSRNPTARLRPAHPPGHGERFPRSQSGPSGPRRPQVAASRPRAHRHSSQREPAAAQRRSARDGRGRLTTWPTSIRAATPAADTQRRTTCVVFAGWIALVAITAFSMVARGRFQTNLGAATPNPSMPKTCSNGAARSKPATPPPSCSTPPSQSRRWPSGPRPPRHSRRCAAYPTSLECEVSSIREVASDQPRRRHRLRHHPVRPNHRQPARLADQLDDRPLTGRGSYWLRCGAGRRADHQNDHRRSFGRIRLCEPVPSMSIEQVAAAEGVLVRWMRRWLPASHARTLGSAVVVSSGGAVPAVGQSGWWYGRTRSKDS